MDKKKIFQIALWVVAVVLVGCLILALVGREHRAGTEVPNNGTSQTTAGTDATVGVETYPDNTTEGSTAGGSHPVSPEDTDIDISIDIEDRTEEPDNTVNDDTNQEDPSHENGEKEDGVIDFKDLLNVGNAGDR